MNQIEIMGLTEFRSKPTKIAKMHDILCILNNGRPVFYTVEPSRMKELLEAEFKLKGLQDGRMGDTEKSVR